MKDQLSATRIFNRMAGNDAGGPRMPVSLIDPDVENHRLGVDDGVVSSNDAQNAQSIDNSANANHGMDFEEAQERATIMANANTVSRTFRDMEKRAQESGLMANMGNVPLGENGTLGNGLMARSNAATAIDYQALKKKKEKEAAFRRLIRLAAEPPINVLLLSTVTDFREMAADPRLDITANESHLQTLSEHYEGLELEEHANALQKKLDQGEPLSSDDRSEALEKAEKAYKALKKKDKINTDISDDQLIELLRKTDGELLAGIAHEHGQINAKNHIKKEFETIADDLQAIYDDNETYPSDEAKRAAYEKVMDEAKNDQELEAAINSLDDEELKTQIRELLDADALPLAQTPKIEEPAAESNIETPIPGLDLDS